MVTITKELIDRARQDGFDTDHARTLIGQPLSALRYWDRCTLAHRSRDPEVQLVLAADEYENVRARLAASRYVTAEARAVLERDESSYVRWKLDRNRVVTQEMIDDESHEGLQVVLGGMLGEPILSLPYSHRSWLAGNSGDQDLLEYLVRHEDDAGNLLPAISRLNNRKLLAVLAEDERFRVRNVARSRLKHFEGMDRERERAERNRGRAIAAGVCPRGMPRMRRYIASERRWDLSHTDFPGATVHVVERGSGDGFDVTVESDPHGSMRVHIDTYSNDTDEMLDVAWGVACALLEFRQKGDTQCKRS